MGQLRDRINLWSRWSPEIELNEKNDEVMCQSIFDDMNRNETPNGSVENLASFVARVGEDLKLVNALARFALHIGEYRERLFRHLSSEGGKRGPAAELETFFCL